MKEINSTLRAYVEAEILPRYELYDEAHRRDHIDSVIAQSLQMAAREQVDPDMVYTIAAYHDLGVLRGREWHHVYSGEMLEADAALRQWFDEGQIATMREAVEDHRASSTHSPRSLYGRIVAEADRQIDAEVVMRRTVQFGLSNYPSLGREEQFARFVDHLRTKYGTGGYLKLYMPGSDNAQKLEELRRIIDQPEELQRSFDRLYDEISKNNNNG
ncbi:MAG: HD domain-containing protein [Tidjanibacter sp.]|nr:HD domain-containing protein [Tidjanibacter sp.]